MKTVKLLLVLLTTAFLLTGCDNGHEPFDNNPPNPPVGLYTVTGDNRVDIFWDDNRERDVAGYNVYFAYEYEGKYTLIGSTESNYFIDDEAINGETYYYAVTAYDFNGNESDLSYAEVEDTPRPEGFNVEVYDAQLHPNYSGYSFQNEEVLPYDDLYTDFYFEYWDGNYYLVVWNEADIQDMGQTKDLWDIDEAPTTGWSVYKDEYAVPGHTYVIRTGEYNYAKVRVTKIDGEILRFDWAYQTVPGNRELKENWKERVRDKSPRVRLRGR